MCPGLRKDRDLKKKNKYFDLKDIIRSKSPKMAKMLPWFLMNYLRRILHEDDLNSFVERNGEKMGIEFAKEILEEFKLNMILIGEENVPKEGRCLLAANHPLGGPDGIAFIVAVSQLRDEINFPVNDILMNIDNLKEFFIPINKHGSNAENIRIFNETFASDKTLLYFPAGLVSRKKKGVIEDLEWKKTFIKKSKQYKRDIIPVYIEGRNSNFFYNLANRRKKLGIKGNIEMLYLINETYKQVDKTMHIVFGEPIPWETFDRSKKDDEWATIVRKKVYALKKENNL